MRLAEIIGKAIDSCYIRPVSLILSNELFRYGVCGGVNMFLDIVWYFLIYHYVLFEKYIDLGIIIVSPHVAALIIVFPITFLTGFWLNRNITFTQSSLRGYKQLWRYILIVALNLLVNYLGLKLCVDILSFYPTPSKMLITLVTVAISFFGQKYFSFK